MEVIRVSKNETLYFIMHDITKDTLEKVVQKAKNKTVFMDREPIIIIKEEPDE